MLGAWTKSERRTVINAPRSNKNESKPPALRLATWNIRTLCPGISNDPNLINDARKTAVINRELKRLSIDVAALQETRLLSSGSIREEDYTFYWQGKASGEHRMHGVGFAVRNSLLSDCTPPAVGTTRILTMRLDTTSGPVNIVSVYAPTLTSSEEEKDKFYDELETCIKKTPASEHLVLLGDFNARVGADNSSWPCCIGQFGVGKVNENGQRLLELCSLHDLCITNTFFLTKPIHRVSWRHPRSRHWHQLDLIITRRSFLNCIKITHSYHSADCDTDHSLVASKVCLKPKRTHRSKPKGQPRIDTARTQDPQLLKSFAGNIEEALYKCSTGSTEEKWNHMRSSIYTTALDSFGSGNHGARTGHLTQTISPPQLQNQSQ